jgi:hypothetical protein
MQYKTIALELLKDRRELYDPLRQARLLVPAMEALASELKASHQRWIHHLTPAGTQGLSMSPEQLSSQAMELALTQMQDRLRSWPALNEPLSPEQAMAFLTFPTSNA